MSIVAHSDRNKSSQAADAQAASNPLTLKATSIPEGPAHSLRQEIPPLSQAVKAMDACDKPSTEDWADWWKREMVSVPDAQVACTLAVCCCNKSLENWTSGLHPTLNSLYHSLPGWIPMCNDAVTRSGFALLAFIQGKLSNNVFVCVGEFSSMNLVLIKKISCCCTQWLMPFAVVAL
jgi:hypothetical protein